MDSCEKPSNFMLLESAFQSCFAVFATHILAGTVDTCLDGGSVAAKLSWLLLYFNPVNLCWRYYSILAYRCLSKNWSEKQLALINFEAFPYRPPVPYVIGERMEDFWVRRLEISGVISSQGMLSVIAAYQGAMAIQFIISTSAVGFLPSISKPIAMLGLIRVMVSNWIASKVYVEPHPYPTEMGDFDSKCNRYLTFGWVVGLLGVLMLSFWPYIGYPEFNIRKSYMDLSMEVLYQYVAISMFLFHVILLSHGPRGLANRILYFDHWSYKLQTLGFVLLLWTTLSIGIVDFVIHNYYRSCP